MKKSDKKLAGVEKEVNNIQKTDSAVIDLSESFDASPEDLQQEIEYQTNVSAIEQDLQEVVQKDRLTEAYNQLYSDNNLEKITDITQQDLGKLSILLTYARQFRFKELENLILNNMRLRVSLRRKGREEHVKISQAEVLRDINQLKLAHRLDSRTNKG